MSLPTTPEIQTSTDNSRPSPSGLRQDPLWVTLLLAGLFLGTLGAHGYFATRNFFSEILPAHEYRETHTALSTLFIQREHNFSLAYPTPVLGKPWSVPYEFPLYEWATVGVSNLTGLPLIPSGRAVSLACFYATLPALWLLLAELALPPSRRLLALTLVLACPLYLFFVRAFLIETTALMFSAWFLLGFVRAVSRRDARWLLLANLAGACAGVAKVTTFMLWLLPAGAFALERLWRGAHPPAARRLDWKQALPVLGWIVAAVALPFAVTIAWIKFADSVKALNVSSADLTAANMTGYHFGRWDTRFDWKLWSALAREVLHSVISPVALGLVALAAFFCRNGRRWIVAGGALFAAGPVIFPILYVSHEYYYIADSVFLLAAIGLVFSGLLDVPRLRPLALPLLGLVLATQFHHYWRQLYPAQVYDAPGGTELSRLISDATDPDDVVVIAGQDWSPALPFYAERRALMIRFNREHDWAYLDRAFANLAGERVRFLLLTGAQRENRSLLDHAVAALGIDPERLAWYHDTDIYVRRDARAEVCRRLFNLGYGDVFFTRAEDHTASAEPQAVDPRRAPRLFAAMTPKPIRYQAPYGLANFGARGRIPLFAAHTTTRLWFKASPEISRVLFEFGMLDNAYADPKAGTDGADFNILAEYADGSSRTVFTRFLDPARRPADRGWQQARVKLSPDSAVVAYVVETRPGPSGNAAFDWAYFGRIELR